jgi:transcriptional regulator with XRE-family HTH domain
MDKILNRLIKTVIQELSSRIRHERIQKKYSRKQMAQKTDTSERTYRRLEEGADFVAIKHYIAACLILDIDFVKPIQEIQKSIHERVRKKQTIEKQEVDF